MKIVHVSKIALLSVLVAATPQISSAISIGSISDAVSNSTTANNKETVKKVEAVNVRENNRNTKNASPLSAMNPALFIEDAAMTAYIHAQLLLNRDIPNVNVATENAVVSLSGTVDTKAQMDTLVKIASSVKGVKFVNIDQLKIRGVGDKI